MGFLVSGFQLRITSIQHPVSNIQYRASSIQHPDNLKRFIREAAARLGFQKVGFAVPEALDREAEDLRSWLKKGWHGELTWMARRLDERTDPRTYHPPVKTIVSLAMNYYTGPPVKTATAPERPRWSRYAWGDDYHRLLKERLKALLGEVAAAFPLVNGIVCVDTAPIMEKVWAERAGLGRQGKHTILITREYGSWLFLGELLLDVALEPDQPFGPSPEFILNPQRADEGLRTGSAQARPLGYAQRGRPFEEDLCGDCTACLDACPTGALTAPYQIDVGRCISYLTTMYKEPFRPDQPSLHGWIYGCDVCQEVCPWNLGCAKPSPEPSFAPREFITAFSWEDWRELSRERWDDLLQGSAARWIGYAGLRRNIEAQAAELGDL